MRTVRQYFLPALAVAGLLFSGCSFAPHKQSRAAVAAPPVPQRIGAIALVNQDLHFVLIDVGSLYVPASGTALKSFSGPAETAILAVDPERDRPFVVADIIKGDPKVGDQVEE